MDYALRLTRCDEPLPEPRDWVGAPWREALPEGKLAALYFGTEFCEERIPLAEEAEAFCARAEDLGLEAVLLTPVVRERGLVRLTNLLEELTRRGRFPSVTFNDWGVARLLRRRFSGCPLQAGRLLNRALRDPRLVSDPDCAPRVASADGDRGALLRNFLLTLEVRGIETDADLEGGFLGEASGSLRRALHFPYVFATTGRHCVVKAGTSDTEGSLARDLAAPCARACRNGPLPERRADTPFPLLRAGNTLFYESPADLARAHLGQADRLILHKEPTP